MMTARQRAIVKTAMVLGLIAIIVALGIVWPLFIGYFMMAVFIGLLTFLIYITFRMIDETKEWDKRR